MIDVHELTKIFRVARGEELVAVDHISFHVESGEVYGLLGPNGAGKTTTLRMILGLLQASSGYAAIDGVRSSDQPEEVKRRVGLVSASAGVYQWLTVRQMLLFFADLYSVPNLRAKRELDQLVRTLGLESFIDQQCSTLSTGQKQRVNLARALIHNPPVVLLDEPTLGLDVVGSQTVGAYIDLLRYQGKAVILSTHRLDEAERLCTRFGLLHYGKFVAEGTLQQLREATGCQSLVEMFVNLTDLRAMFSESPGEATAG